MGIFMITISQINSHTMDRVYPSNQPATRGLEPSLDQLLSVAVVLRDVEAGARPAGLDAASGGNPHG